MAKYLQLWKPEQGWPQATIDLWVEALARYDDDLLARGFRELVATYKYPQPPLPGNLVECIGADQQGRDRHNQSVRDFERALAAPIHDAEPMTAEQLEEHEARMRGFETAMADLRQPERLKPRPLTLNEKMGNEWMNEQREKAFRNLRPAP